jgi:acetylornithine aminotransferase
VTDSLFEKEHRFFFQTYKRLSLEIERGEGCYLYDRNGNRYLDFFGGLAVNALGYNHPRVKDSIIQQINKYIHLSNYYVQEPQIRLAEKLITATGYRRVFFTNSGTEAIEGAIKLARKWGKKNGKRELFGLSNSFHGRTLGALSLTERSKYRDGYEPFLPNIGHLPFNDAQELRAKVNASTLGIVLEVIQGEGGINVISAEFVAELKRLREEFGFLIIADEIQSGLGRTGKFFGFEHFDLQPDIVAIAKPLGGGLPLGAFLGNERVESTFSYGEHGTTFGGNPVACAAGLVVIEEIVEKGLMRNAAEVGDYLKTAFLAMQREMPQAVTDIRGFGCMLGIELAFEGQPVVDALQARGILVNCTNTNVIRLLPPLVISLQECDRLIAEFRSVVRDLATLNTSPVSARGPS